MSFLFSFVSARFVRCVSIMDRTLEQSYTTSSRCWLFSIVGQAPATKSVPTREGSFLLSLATGGPKLTSLELEGRRESLDSLLKRWDGQKNNPRYQGEECDLVLVGVTCRQWRE